MTSSLKPSPEELARLEYLETMLADFPREQDPDWDSLTAWEQEFLASLRERFRNTSDLTLGQEESLINTWQKWQEDQQENQRKKRKEPL